MAVNSACLTKKLHESIHCISHIIYDESKTSYHEKPCPERRLERNNLLVSMLCGKQKRKVKTANCKLTGLWYETSAYMCPDGIYNHRNQSSPPAPMSADEDEEKF